MHTIYIIIFTNNLEINNKKHYYNDKDTFKFKKNDWKNSLDILYRDIDINYKKLYIIIQSYASNRTYITSKIYIIIYTTNMNYIITEYKDISFIRKCSYIDFLNWYIIRLDRDNKYSEIENFDIIYHGIRIVFFKNINKKHINMIRPKTLDIVI